MIIKRIVAATFIVLSGTAIDAQAENAFRVTLLGTGTPLILPDRLGPATLVEAGNLKLLFDAGRGVPLRLAQVGISPAKIDVLFITHYHSDHVHGIPDLWLTGWLQAGGQRTEAFHVIGPTGAKNLMTNLERAFSSDISMRIADQDLPPAGVTPRVDEFAADGIVYERDGVRVTAFEVDHGAAIKPAYGYRIDYGGRSALVSGDTRFSENLIRNGMNVDLLVHAIAGSKPELMQNPIMRVILDHHTLPPAAAVVFNRTKPKLAVYTHFVLLGTPKVPAPSTTDIFAETRETYSGPLQIGEDLMSFDLTETGVKVNPPRR